MSVEKHMTSTVQNILRTAHDAVSAMTLSVSPGEVFFMSETIIGLLNVLKSTVKELPTRIYMRNNPMTHELAKNVLNKLRKVPTQNLSKPANDNNALSIKILSDIMDQTKR